MRHRSGCELQLRVVSSIYGLAVAAIEKGDIGTKPRGAVTPRGRGAPHDLSRLDPPPLNPFGTAAPL